MAVVWGAPGISGAEATEAVSSGRDVPLSQRTIVTVLTRLDAKGYLTHTVDGRSFRYRAALSEAELVERHARQAVVALIDRYGDDAVIAGLLDVGVDAAALARVEAALERHRTRGRET